MDKDVEALGQRMHEEVKIFSNGEHQELPELPAARLVHQRHCFQMDPERKGKQNHKLSNLAHC